MVKYRAVGSRKRRSLDARIREYFTNTRYSSAFSGATTVWRRFNEDRVASGKTTVPLSKVKNALAGVKSSVSHKLPRKPKKTLRILSTSINEYWSTDTIFWSLYEDEQSEGYPYSIGVIDHFSRYAYCRPLRTKKASEVTKAFVSIAEEAGTYPLNLVLDRGTEYKKEFLELMKQHNVNVIYAYGRHKASLIERFNRTLQSRVHRWMSTKRAGDWERGLQPIVKAYNNTMHSTIGATPSSITWRNQETLYRRYYSKYFKQMSRAPSETALKIGQRVVVELPKNLAMRSYTERWSTQEYIIAKIITSNPTTYKVKDSNDKVLKRKYYGSELQPIMFGKRHSDLRDIEQLDSRRGKNNRTEILIRFLGDAAGKERWVDSSEVVNMRR